ncbi:NAD(P)-dependent oxidoreductase [Brevibacillus fulvus]|uniref:3-hydroxyisobutyrate dehydrogenase/2-hydroxy-3-oxopropionate reductase n=1 Tax=Brevibacillus fulvus TaxID=1125967 RepID=A0A938Y4B7_9BACL|nr:NAD(P)-dependent oxidoreductase [Brevibacillus fulvus]MBM7590980.1 3-hydroxyisobutyrate dehydrogenase/2-hydroxy-3-oxopropionate reductase [Brevibacillus fulvus]
MQKIGFIGLGTMGLPMTKNLLKAGFPVYVVSRSRGPIETAVSLGAVEAANPRDLAEKTDILLTCLPLPDTIEQVYFGANGLLEADLQGKLIIDHSTVSPLLNKRVYAAIAEKGGSYMDAPISGGPMGAEAGTLAIMCGGAKSDYDRAQPVFAAMGQHLFHVGEIGTGSIVKLMNNYLIGVHTAALAETFILATKAGVDTNIMYDIISASTGDSKMLHRIVPLVHQRDFAARFSNELLYKDMKLAGELAEAYELEMPINRLAEQKYALAKEKYPKEDMAALFKIYEEQTGIVVKGK